MAIEFSKHSGRLLSEQQVAEYCRIGLTTLRRYRSKRRGPKFVRLGGTTVRYRRADVLDWLDSITNNS